MGQGIKKKTFLLLISFFILCVGCTVKETYTGDTKEISGNTGSGTTDETPAADKTETPEESLVDDSSTAAAENSVTDETAAVAEKTQSVNLVMAGDILLHSPVEEAARDDETGKYDFDFIFDHSREYISAADIAVVNQEVMIGGEELGVSGYPAFNAPYEISDALVKAGFDVVCHATNHALDKGKKGIINCLDHWRETYPDILVTGIYDNEEDASFDVIPVIERNGIKIAILSYTYGTNGISPPSDMKYAVSMLEKDRVISQLDLAEEKADLTVVCPHWGTEYSHNISGEQKKWMEIFREHGADVVIGTHPHVTEPYVFYEDEDTENNTNNHGSGDMLVFYSLGNFVNWTSGSGPGVADRMVGAMADITVSRKEDGEVSIDSYGVRNLVCHVRSGERNVTVYPLEEYTDDLAAENEIIKQDSSFSKEYCEDLCERVFGDT